MPASAGLLNLYEQIRAGEVDIVHAPEPEKDVLHELGFFFGPQLGWDRDREGESRLAVEWACDLATGEVLIVELCRVCLDGFGDYKLGDRVVCAGCLRCSMDPKIKAILADEARLTEAEAAREEAARKARRQAAKSAKAGRKAG